MNVLFLQWFYYYKKVALFKWFRWCMISYGKYMKFHESEKISKCLLTWIHKLWLFDNRLIILQYESTNMLQNVVIIYVQYFHNFKFFSNYFFSRPRAIFLGKMFINYTFCNTILSLVHLFNVYSTSQHT